MERLMQRYGNTQGTNTFVHKEKTQKNQENEEEKNISLGKGLSWLMGFSWIKKKHWGQRNVEELRG